MAAPVRTIASEPAAGSYNDPVTIRLPEAHEHQAIFLEWSDLHPEAQVLVAPCGVKLGKSFGAALWLLKEALTNSGFYCVWAAPTLYKARVGYRYIKAMLPDIPLIRCVDGSLEIYLANGSFIKFLHGRDAETTIEGDAIDAFVIDEAGKHSRQIWLSTFTTITQTKGRGIITGTPRGHTWYAEIFKMAKGGDPFFAWCQLPTWYNPYVSAESVENAKRLLPKNLFDQYYRALFISFSTVFGELDEIWDEDLQVAAGKGYWLHPDVNERLKDSCTGADWAKVNDFTVFSTVNCEGKLTGYCRFRGGPYPQQVLRLKKYLAKFGDADMMLKYDKTGVGQALEDIIAEAEIDASIEGVSFTNNTKQEMVTRGSCAISDGWLKVPRIERIETELTALEVTVSKTGRHTYGAPDGEHDDVAWSLLMAINGAYESAKADATERMIIESMSDRLGANDQDDDPLAGYADLAAGDEQDDEPEDLEDDDFDEADLDA